MRTVPDQADLLDLPDRADQAERVRISDRSLDPHFHTRQRSGLQQCNELTQISYLRYMQTRFFVILRLVICSANLKQLIFH